MYSCHVAKMRTYGTKKNNGKTPWKQTKMVKCRRLHCLPSLSFSLSLFICAYLSRLAGEKWSQFQLNKKKFRCGVAHIVLRCSSERVRRSSDRVRRSSDRVRWSRDIGSDVAQIGRFLAQIVVRRPTVRQASGSYPVPAPFKKYLSWAAAVKKSEWTLIIAKCVIKLCV